jgi:hypothetical protein
LVVQGANALQSQSPGWSCPAHTRGLFVNEAPCHGICSIGGNMTDVKGTEERVPALGRSLTGLFSS